MERREFQRHQLIGALTGLIGGLVASGYWPELRARLDWYGAAMWGGVIGLFIASLPKYYVVGQRITGSENHRTLNLMVGMGIVLAIVLVVLTVAGLILK